MRGSTTIVSHGASRVQRAPQPVGSESQGAAAMAARPARPIASSVGGVHAGSSDGEDSRAGAGHAARAKPRSHRQRHGSVMESPRGSVLPEHRVRS